jgi:hydroxyethylthiazole kinase-like uncharacterized protein yjeF
MIPIVTPLEMGVADKSSSEPVDVLVARAGAAVARQARKLLGGTYGRRVLVVAGKGNNGADGRAAAVQLSRWGASVRVLEASQLGPGQLLTRVDLVIDAAYGTGFRGTYAPPDPGGSPVLAVDIPSGLSGLTGLAGKEPAPGPDSGSPVATAVSASATITFAALKPGLLLGDGPIHSGRLSVVDIGLGDQVDAVCSTWLVTDADVISRLPRRGRDAHKWKSALRVVAGSAGMTGAAVLVSTAAMRAGAGYVRLGLPGIEGGLGQLRSGEVVVDALPESGWDDVVLADIERFSAMVVGPGLGRSPGITRSVAQLISGSKVPTVVDADGLNALGSAEELRIVAAQCQAPVVITPHDGEYARLVGEPPAADRIASARTLSRSSGTVVLLKGPATVVAAPDGRVLVVTTGSPRLATAGTGDVLSGTIGGFLARGLPPLEAAAFAAHVHGRAAELGLAEGLVAGDLPELVARWLSDAH